MSGHRSLGLILALVLIGCAATEPDPEEQVVNEKLEDILSQPLDADEYGASRRCISQLTFRDFQTVGNRYVLFEGAGDKLWLNELRGHCPGLRHASALAFERSGSQICNLDQFKVTDVFQWSRFRRWPWDWMDGIPCTLGEFQPVTTEQVEAIRAALENR
jgi:hypothetical protein